MQKQVLSKQLFELKQKRERLAETETVAWKNTGLLEDFNNDARSFLKLNEQFVMERTKELISRMRLQTAMSKLDLDESSFIMFWDDQLSFYGNWLALFDQEWYAEQDRCLLKLSVREILMILRLSKDLNLLGDAQLKKLFQFISLNIRTDRQQLLSYESLRKKYSQIDLVVLRQVKIVLDRLSNRTNHYFALLSNK